MHCVARVSVKFKAIFFFVFFRAHRSFFKLVIDRRRWTSKRRSDHSLVDSAWWAGPWYRGTGLGERVAGDPHYKESYKESHTVCPYFSLVFLESRQILSLFQGGWGWSWGVLRGGAFEEEEGGRRGQGETQKKEVIFHEASSQAGPHLCVSTLAGVSLQRLAGLPLSASLLPFCCRLLELLFIYYKATAL